MALEIRVSDIEKDAEEIIRTSRIVSAKLDQLMSRLFAGVCVICGLVIGSKMLSIEQIEHLKNIFGP